MNDLNEITPIFKINAPSEENLAAFHRDGFILYPAVFTDEGLKGFLDEFHRREQVVDLFNKHKDNPEENRMDVRPWDNKGPWSNQLFDAPLVTALLRAIIGNEYHFCHSTMHIKMRGSKALRPHMDHHHWFHNNPVNLAERNKWYVQMLYYPNGFKLGDCSLSVVPGSHLPTPTTDPYLSKLIEGNHDEFYEMLLNDSKLKHLELPPGSMVCLNARTIHAAEAKPMDSPQEYRIFANYIFKEVGPPHRHTQAIPPEWLQNASPERKMLFQREPYTEECWADWEESKCQKVGEFSKQPSTRRRAC